MLGKALFSFKYIFEKTIKKSIDEKNGDYSPEIYILTGGKPSDSPAAYNVMEQILEKRNLRFNVGVTSSTVVPS